MTLAPLIRDNQCLDTDFNKTSERTGNLTKISVKRSSLQMTDCTDKGSFPEHSFVFFQNGVYWNNAIYWLNHEGKFFKLDIMNEHPVLTTLQTPLTLDRKVHYECRLFESRDCLLLVGKDDAHSRHFTIYEKGNVYSKWSMKYIVNLDESIKLYPKRWSIEELIYCIVLGEREEDSFLVMELDKKVVQYKIVSKSLSTISDLGPDEDLHSCFQFIPSFANV